MKVNISPRLLRESFWLLPFVFLALCSLSLARPWRTIPPVSEGRPILDGHGKTVIIPEPFPGVVVAGRGSEFLSKTHSPESVLKAGGPRDRPRQVRITDLILKIYPRFLNDDALWDFPGNLESILANDTGAVYLAGSAPDIYGFTNINASPPSFADSHNVIFTMIRVWNEVIGKPERAEELIELYRKEFAALENDMLVLGKAPTVAGVISPTDEWSRCYGFFMNDVPGVPLAVPEAYPVVYGRESDAERILYMNPDVIIIRVGDFGGFIRDARWRGLDAVEKLRVYQNVVNINGYTFDLDHRPLASRWIAEIAYPDKLRPELRGLLQRHYEESYGYRPDDDEIDALLNVKENEGAAYYERFMRPSEKLMEREK